MAKRAAVMTSFHPPDNLSQAAIPRHDDIVMSIATSTSSSGLNMCSGGPAAPRANVPAAVAAVAANALADTGAATVKGSTKKRAASHASAPIAGTTATAHVTHASAMPMSTGNPRERDKGSSYSSRRSGK